jgi:hypothetical protein
LNTEKNNAGQLLDGWEKLEARCREIIGWRMQLVPYLMAAFQRYAEDGTPPFRALVLDAPREKRLQGVDDQYMIGDRMMVAPMFAGEPSRKVVLPEGAWHNFWTGERLKGGAELSVPASTEKIPVYVRSGLGGRRPVCGRAGIAPLYRADLWRRLHALHAEHRRGRAVPALEQREGKRGRKARRLRGVRLEAGRLRPSDVRRFPPDGARRRVSGFLYAGKGR